MLISPGGPARSTGGLGKSLTRAYQAAFVAVALGCHLGTGSLLGQETSSSPALPSEIAPCANTSPTVRAPEGHRERTDPTSSTDPVHAADLFCIDLFSTPAGGDATGMIRLTRPWSPFGASVTPTGRHRHRLTSWVEGLPDPGSLGPYSTYVAWAAPLTLDSLIRLGAAGNGTVELGEVALNKYLILVTAESDAGTRERTGPLVMRGRSPSSRMEAHDLTALAPSAEVMGEGGTRMEDPATGEAWSLPPMYAGIPMLPGVMSVRPTVSPYLPIAPTESSAIPEAQPPRIVDLPNGGTLDLTAGFASKHIAGRELTLMAFNGQIPGPLIRVGEGSTIFVNFTNDTPLPTAVHWHGIRLDNRFDGVPGVTQDPVPPGGDFRYQIFFPDAGIYWYHPHHREDVMQELGLSGNMMVKSRDPDYYGPADRDVALILDDLLLTDDGTVPFGAEATNYALMGRFGNVLLVNGEPEYELTVGAGEVIRLHLTNASNTRTFNLSLRDGELGSPVPLKVVASDVGRFERESLAESVVLAPAERYVVEALFTEPGLYAIVNQVQGINHRMGVFREEMSQLGTVTVEPVDEGERPDHAHSFPVLRENAEVIRDIDSYRAYFDRPVDHELVLTLRTDGLPMAIEQSMLFERAFANPVEWSGTMPTMNWASTGAEVSWILRDPATGLENDDIAWRFRVGDVVKVRLVNDRWAFHAMQHPLHIHGQRFLVLEQDGVRNENMAWKDTVLLPAGSTTDILLELSNPGLWMVHCHIAEHLESGMKFVFEVVDEG